MAPHRVANVLFERLEVIGFGEDRLAQGASGIASIGRFLDEANDLVHWMILRRK
jgi:hypothetical protein